MILHRWRRQHEERVAEAERATERTQRLADAVSPLLAEAQAVTDWANRRMERNHLAELFMEGRR